MCECYALVEHISFHCSGLFSTPSLLRKCLNAQKVASKFFFFFLKKEIWGDIFAFIARTVLVFSVSLYGRFNLGDWYLLCVDFLEWQSVPFGLNVLLVGYFKSVTSMHLCCLSFSHIIILTLGFFLSRISFFKIKSTNYLGSNSTRKTWNNIFLIHIVWLLFIDKILPLLLSTRVNFLLLTLEWRVL